MFRQECEVEKAPSLVASGDIEPDAGAVVAQDELMFSLPPLHGDGFAFHLNLRDTVSSAFDIRNR